MWREGCKACLARALGGQGLGSRPQSSERDRQARRSGHKTLLSLVPPAPGVLRQRAPVRSLRHYG